MSYEAINNHFQIADMNRMYSKDMKNPYKYKGILMILYLDISPLFTKRQSYDIRKMFKDYNDISVSSKKRFSFLEKIHLKMIRIMKKKRLLNDLQ